MTQSNFYVKQAVAYAQCHNKQEARTSLDHARASFPTNPENDPAFLYADFGQSSFFLSEGLTFLELAHHGLTQPQDAWNKFAQVEEAGARIMSERIRIEIINHQVGAAVVMEDIDRFCAYLTKGIEGATRLGSAKRRQEAVHFYWQARKLWPHETRVKDLAEVFLHDGQDRGVMV